ncbi:MAG: NAD-dependent epimerase [Prolixibacteraceae bacterium]|nr:NAD-dependent epimerase [Prolixibacteraceae bacterium]
MKILVTGSAGFVGFHLTEKLLELGYQVVGIDNINDYYNPALKYARLAESGIERQVGGSGEMVQSEKYAGYKFKKAALEDEQVIFHLFESEQFDVVCNLAAQAGVRYSLENPKAYVSSNIKGFLNILEACRRHPVNHLLYASSSSVYGNSVQMPLSTSQRTDAPVSLYAATKKSNELMAYTYAHLFGIQSTGLRFFTVYGPWGRPDMAYFSFAKNIVSGKPIKVFNNGDLYRDFTYIDDIVEGIVRILKKPSLNESPPTKVYNIGNSSPVSLMYFIETLEKALGKKALKEFYPMQPGDVYKTFADVSDLENEVGYHPFTSIETGLNRFAEWFLKEGVGF